MIVWQDMINGGGKYNFLAIGTLPFLGMLFNNKKVGRVPDGKKNNLFYARTDEKGKEEYYKDSEEMINLLYNVPSLDLWTPFNEAWGQFDTKVASDYTKSLDPTRLVNAASGGNFELYGDIQDVHHYPAPMMNAFERKMINAIGEYGGIGYPVDGHLWKITDNNWGYGEVMSSG
jgi:hypothetical protein